MQTPQPQIPETINIRHRKPPGAVDIRGRQIATIARAALIRFSSYAGRHFVQHPDHRTFSVRTEAPESAIRYVLDWMEAHTNAVSPLPLACPEEFEQAVWVLQVCQAMSVHAHLQGEEVVEGVKCYVRMAPLTVGEFAMVFEVLPFKEGLRELCVAETVRRLAEEGPRGVPEWEGIREYCEENGIAIGDGEGGEEDVEEGGKEGKGSGGVVRA